MSRMMAILVSLMYMVGGFTAGVYGCAWYLKVNGAESLAFLHNEYLTLLPALLIIALALHLSQNFKARRANTDHRNRELELGGRLGRTEAELDDLRMERDEEKKLLEFCRKAIANTATKNMHPLGDLKDLPLYEDDKFDMSKLRAVKIYNNEGDGPEIKRQVQPKDYVAGKNGEENINVTRVKD